MDCSAFLLSTCTWLWKNQPVFHVLFTGTYSYSDTKVVVEREGSPSKQLDKRGFNFVQTF